MLKKLELVGFKSFADKTSFAFGDGITAIVGPNGSGKSNVVDAVRWIMGEQSAKSLRGGEMADVIFNGSTVRRSLGLAEVTMTFDNTRRQLTFAADEVQITRRVYRDGQGEYLINQQPCRLKDIKEMFLGSGVGNDAYCVIEQGKVDVLLQASTRERRIIFEEAAGISRFKAKKVETLRKLERVDQNLQRLRDIQEEVEKQLRSVKLQAAKAQRYQEYSERLKELRLGQGLSEYHQLTQSLDAETQVLEKLRVELEDRAVKASSWEAETEQLEILLTNLEDNLREQEAALARIRQQIQSEETTLAHEASLTADLEAELGRTRGRLCELTGRVTVLAETAARAHDELAAAQSLTEQQRRLVHERQEVLQASLSRLQELHQQLAQDKVDHLDLMRRAAHLQNEAVADKAQVDNLTRERQRLERQSAQASESLASLDVELQELTEADQALQARLLAARQSLAEQRQERQRLQQLHGGCVEQLSQLRQERSALAGRVEILENLIRSHEGLGSGVREVLALLDQADPGPWSAVLGIIADFLTVKREYAPLIDLALGDWAQRFLVRDMDQLVEALAGRAEPFSGRVSFLPVLGPDGAAEDGTVESGPGYAALQGNRLVEVSLMSRVRRAATPAPQDPGLVAPAEQVVSCDHAELADLPGQLLGRTLIVHDLNTARTIAARAPGFRLVTLQGELLEPDGTLTVGTAAGEIGILSRKSQLQDLREQLARLEERVGEMEKDEADLRARTRMLDERVPEQQEEADVLAEQAADLRNRVERHRDRRHGLHEEVELRQGEMQRLNQEISHLESTWNQARQQAAEAEEQVQLLHQRMHQAEHDIRGLEDGRQTQQHECTQAQIALAKVEERLHALQSEHLRLDQDLQQCRHELAQGQVTLANLKQRLQDSQRTMLNASAHLAQAYLDKEAAQKRAGELLNQRDLARQERVRLGQQAQTIRSEWRVQQEHVHNREMEASDLRHRRDTLADRLREDYQIDLGQLYRDKLSAEPKAAATDAAPESGPSPVAAAVQEEIDELRRKLSRLGSVNLEALQELHELETRAQTLQTQVDDLTGAKKSLEEIIAKINVDSRTLFTDTFTAIRTHFQELFRKLFGGGMADVVLEDETDVLESGIEIIARPPGKELRSISLMSGGEKTLTAVALLLAIFRSKPSPFCILDEVDAALDEANIGRFTSVIREFLDRSQFIIVTHSKKTMATADVLYGVTMQESGVSKQVSVRFEDWPDDREMPQANGEAAAGEAVI